MRGLPPTPLHLKLLKGNPGKRRLRPEPEPEPAREPQCPDPPPFVRGFGADEWFRTAPELWRLGLLTTLDTATFAIYCMSYMRWRCAMEALEQVGESDPAATAALLVKSADGNLRANPLVAIASRAAADMLTVAGQFGMTPVARTRLAAGPNGQPPGGGKFAGARAAHARSGSPLFRPLRTLLADRHDPVLTRMTQSRVSAS